jgi:hypothetical protein
MTFFFTFPQGERSAHEVRRVSDTIIVAIGRREQRRIGALHVRFRGETDMHRTSSNAR